MRCRIRATQCCRWSGHISLAPLQAHDGSRSSHSSQPAEKGDTLVDFLGQCGSVVVSGQVLADVHCLEHGACSSQVHIHLLCLLYIQREIVVTSLL